MFGLSCSLGHDIARTYSEFQAGGQVYLSCGDSAKTDCPSESVDVVVTDPPFFDNVHYSQLADFFYIWQRYILRGNDEEIIASTRSPDEVQHSAPETFTERLSRVWAECCRVLKRDGLLVFTYHHSRPEGWRSLLEALVPAGFVIVVTHPIKAEMSVAAPKHQAKEPIDLDIILVCHKRTFASGMVCDLIHAIPDAVAEAEKQVARLNSVGRSLSLNDVRVILMAQLIKRLSWHTSLEEATKFLVTHAQVIEAAIARLRETQFPTRRLAEPASAQLALWS